MKPALNDTSIRVAVPSRTLDMNSRAVFPSSWMARPQGAVGPAGYRSEKMAAAVDDQQTAIGGWRYRTRC